MVVAAAAVAAACRQSWDHTVVDGTAGQAVGSVNQVCTAHLGRSGRSGCRPCAYRQAVRRNNIVLFV